MSFFQTLWLLVLAHFICDYSLQSGFIATCKNPNVDSRTGIPWYYVMSGHCATHAMAVYLITQSTWMSAAEFVLHFVTDTDKCCAGKHASIHKDQATHIMCKVCFAIFLQL